MAEATAPFAERNAEQGDMALSRARWSTVVLASIGGSLEFYDFIIYGIFAGSISHQFFPADDPRTALILSFSVLALGYLARPVGGVVIGGIGDRFGRRGVFVASLGVTTAATVAIGLLPSYRAWGVVSPVLLVGLRLVQGLCLGGELPGSLTYAVEAAPRRAGLACGFIIFCVNTGVLLSTLVNLLIQRWLSEADVAAFGWRIAFLVGGAIGIVNLGLRRHLKESPVFLQLRSKVARFPLQLLVRKHARQVVAGAGVVAAIAGFNGILFGYMPAYLVQVLHYSATDAASAIAVAVAVISIGNIFFGWLSDHVPRRIVLRVGACALAVGAIPFFSLLGRHAVDLTALLAAFSVVFSISSGVWSSVLAELFPPEVRFSGIALSYNLCVTIVSGFAPLIAASFNGRGYGPDAPGVYVALAAAVTVLSSFFIAPVPSSEGPEPGRNA